jgi:hypothetical protein
MCGTGLAKPGLLINTTYDTRIKKDNKNTQSNDYEENNNNIVDSAYTKKKDVTDVSNTALLIAVMCR